MHMQNDALAMGRSPAMDDARECWVCLELADTGGGAAAPTGCACRGSAGRAHLSCLISVARHKTDRQDRHTAWIGCPTCKQYYTGPMDVGLARARWAPLRDGPWGGQRAARRARPPRRGAAPLGRPRRRAAAVRGAARRAAADARGRGQEHA